jgi:hypothetical protein
MRRRLSRVVAATLIMCGAARVLCAQETIDRIVARVENDIILLSEVRGLSQYQWFLDGKTETDAAVLDRLIDQWVVRTEADTARFPHPTEAEIARDFERLKKSFATPEEFEARKKQAALNDAELRAFLAAQLYLSSYLDSRFRPSVQVDPKAIQDFYESGVVPRAKARGQEPPTLEAARETIQETLIQMGINEQADRWLKESRARLHVEKVLDEGGK